MIQLGIYNILTRKSRFVTIQTPEVQGQQSNTLGALTREEEFENAHERVLRVVKIFPDSPAQKAGLIENKDCILGTSNMILKDLQSFANYIRSEDYRKGERSVEICVLNLDSMLVRDVNIFPNENWGGLGLLGCEFAEGVMNSLPEFNEPPALDLSIHSDDTLSLVYQPETLEIRSIHSEADSNFFKDAPQAEDAFSAVLDRDRDIDFRKEKNLPNLIIDKDLNLHTNQSTPLFNQDIDPAASTAISKAEVIENPSPSPFQIKPISITDVKSPTTIQAEQTFPGKIVQAQKSSLKRIPKPDVNANIKSITQNNKSSPFNASFDISPIPGTSMTSQLGSASKNSFYTFNTPRAVPTISTAQIKTPPMTPILQAVKEDSSINYERRKSRKSIEDSGKLDHFTQKNEGVIIETYFQGFERYEHISDESQEFPKIIALNNQDLTNLTTTVFDKSGVESQKSLDLTEIHEKPVCTTIIQYTFHSKKLGGEYIIKSTDLFNFEEPKEQTYRSRKYTH